jgi:DNA repair protein RecN (Recombination protein N)
MLLSLKIQNFALIDQLDLGFRAGLNVLTGETGAGKSIILDALDLALGGKATPQMIRTGSDRAVIEALFQLTPAIAQWLEAHDIDPLEEGVVCSRDLTLNQTTLRSRSRVNGVLVNRQQLDSLRDRMVEMTAQGQTVQLGDLTQQRFWLDQFGGSALLTQRSEVSRLYAIYHEAQQALDQRRNSEHQRLQRLDLLTFQVNELKGLSLDDPAELNQLTQDYQRLSHSLELQQQSYQVYQILYADDQGGLAASDLLGKSVTILNNMLAYDPDLQTVVDLVQDALAQVEEAGRQINHYGGAIETDPQRLQEIEERIADLKQACRKYGPTLADAIAYWQTISTELQAITDSEQSLELLEQSVRDRQNALTQACLELTRLRQQAGTALEAKLLQELKPLAMEKVRFQVDVAECPPTAAGSNRITFLFSPNPGEPLQPLAAIASGGEMSRFLLALKTCFSSADNVETLVFDEIDVGVSGRVTQAIAQKLHQLSRQQQVLCVTHQAIVASMADAHFQVSKHVIDAEASKNGSSEDPDALNSESLRTVVRVICLDAQQRRTELAQLAGGQSGQAAIAFADVLLDQATELKQQVSANHESGWTQEAPSKRKTKRKSEALK